MRTDALLGPVAGVVAAILALACEAGLPRPRFVQQTTAALRLVGYPPPPARVEMIPRRPAGDPVWIDGEWSWSGSAWGWVAGRWVVAPPGTFFAAWTTVRDAEGNVYFASGAWHDASGAEIAAPGAGDGDSYERERYLGFRGLRENNPRAFPRAGADRRAASPMKDAVTFGALVVAFAGAFTCHIALAYGLAHGERRIRGLIALLIPPLAPYWGFRERMRLRSIGWIVFVVLYSAAWVVGRL